MDRAPEAKTIRRKLAQLATKGKAAQFQDAIASHHIDRLDDTDQLGLLFCVDGHSRAYQGKKKIAKTHMARLQFPAPTTVEAWVSDDADGDPLVVAMTRPGASLAAELGRLLPDLRATIGDGRRVLVRFDRGGWSPTLFAHMHAEDFDVLTGAKQPPLIVTPRLSRGLNSRTKPVVDTPRN